jgi:hypothetical protein
MRNRSHLFLNHILGGSVKMRPNDSQFARKLEKSFNTIYHKGVGS